MELKEETIKQLPIEKRLSAKVIKVCERLEVSPDLIDWQSELMNAKDYDDKYSFIVNLVKNYSALASAEKQMRVEELLKINTKKSEQTKQVCSDGENKIIREREEVRLLTEYQQVTTTTDLLNSPSFYQMKERITMVAKGFYDVCFIISEGGWAKTHTTFQLTNGIDCAYISCKVTPLELYKTLYENRDREIIILDDLKYENEIIVSVLKGAWQSISNGKRLVQYNSSKLNIPKVFEIKARFICLANKIPKTTDMNALTSRTLFYEFNPTYKEKIHLLEQISKRNYKDLTQEERTRVFEFIKTNSNPSINNLNLRTFQRICDYFRYKKTNDEWVKLAIEELKADDRIALVYELVSSQQPIDTQIEIFRDKTGQSRATYFRIKNRLV